MAATSTRRRDPQRRPRIARAAIDVVAEHGIAGLTHRRVAAAADVPLGSTTYHFADLEQLLAAALAQVNEDYRARLPAWRAQLERRGLVAGLADLTVEQLTRDRARTIVEHELYLGAIRRPQLRELAADCIELFVALLADFSDERTAWALAVVVDGVTVQALASDTTPTRDELTALLATVAGR